MARLFQNFIGGELDATLAVGATSMSSPELAAMREVVAPDTMTITLAPASGTPEVVLVTAHTASATTATIIRAQESTTDQEHVSTTTWRHDITAEAMTENRVRVEDVAGTSYTVDADDEGKVLRFTEATLVTVTLPVDLDPGYLVHLLFVGAAGGAVQDDGTSVVAGEGTVAQNAEASCLVVAADTWNVQGTA
jgi:hypothetical protein